MWDSSFPVPLRRTRSPRSSPPARLAAWTRSDPWASTAGSPVPGSPSPAPASSALSARLWRRWSERSAPRNRDSAVGSCSPTQGAAIAALSTWWRELALISTTASRYGVPEPATTRTQFRLPPGRHPPGPDASQRFRARHQPNHTRMRKRCPSFSLESAPGTRLVIMPRGAHLVLGIVIRAWPGHDLPPCDSRRVIAPLGLEDNLSSDGPGPSDAVRNGLCAPEEEARFADGPAFRGAAFRMAASRTRHGGLLSMMINNSELNSSSPVLTTHDRYVTHDFTGDRRTGP